MSKDSIDNAAGSHTRVDQKEVKAIFAQHGGGGGGGGLEVLNDNGGRPNGASFSGSFSPA